MKMHHVRRAAVSAAVAISSAQAAQVSWTGAGDGVNWSNPANWSGGVVPGAADDVTINIAANPTIVISGVSPTIRSLTNAEILRLTAGSTLTVTTTASSSGQLLIAGGVMGGGAWTFTGGAMAEVTGSTEGRLAAGTTINGDVVFPSTNGRLRVNVGATFTTARLRGSGVSMAFEPGYVLGSQVVLEGSSVSGHLELYADGTLTISPTAVLTNAAGATGTLNVGTTWWYSATTALDLRGTITNGTPSSGFTINPSSLVTTGTTRINNTGGGTMNVGVRTNPQAWTNNGVITATSGRINLEDACTNVGTVQASGTGRVTFEGSWTNTGTINVSGTARLDLGGSFTTAGMGTISRGPGGNGVIAVTGAWNNTGSSFAFTPATGSYVLDGGTVTGGTLTPSANERLTFASAANGLVGVSYGGEIICDVTNGRVRIDAGTTVTGIRLRGSGGGVSFAPGYVINFPIIFDGTGTRGTVGIDMISEGTLTVGPSGSITTEGDWTGTVNFGGAWWGRAATLINRGTITLGGTGRTFTFAPTTFTNEGTLTLAAGGLSNFDMVGTDTAWSNAGAFTATDATVNLRDRWTLTTPLTATNSTISMGGRFDGASATRVQRTGGAVNLVGTLENTGQTTTLSAATGSWRIDGGTIQGGNFNMTPTARLIPANSASVLDSVALNQELVFDGEASSRVRVIGTTTMPRIVLRSSNANVSFGPGYVINFPIVSDGSGLVTHAVDSVTAGDALTVGPQGSIVSAPGSLAALSIGEGWHGARTGTLVNQGLIESGALNRGLDIEPTSFVNQGTVRVRNGVDATVSGLTGNVTGFDVADAGSTIDMTGVPFTLTGTTTVAAGTTWTLRGQWSNAGQLAINGGNLRLDGTFTLSAVGSFLNTGGVVTILGTLNNPASLTLNAATGSWVMSGGTINGGVVNQTQGSQLQFASSTVSTLNNVQFAEELVVNAGRVRMEGTSRAPRYRLASSGAGVAFAAGHVLNEVVECTAPSGSTGLESISGNLTIGPSGVARVTSGSMLIGSAYISDGTRTLTNNGVIEAVGGTANVDPPTLTNLDDAGVLTGGRWRSVNSTLTMPRSVTRNNAEVELSGTAGSANEFASLAENTGRLTLGNNRDMTVLASSTHGTVFTNSGALVLGAGSRLTVGSQSRGAAFVQTEAGSTRVDLGGADALSGFGNMRVFGEASLAGEIEAGYVNGYVRACGQVFQFMDANSRAGNYTRFDLPPVTEETVFLYFVDADDARFTVSARADFNEDGFLDFFDYDDYVSCFEGNCPPGRDADFNGDGFVDFFDYDDYVFRFEAGC